MENEGRKTEIRDAIKKTLDAMLTLCPAYNPLILRLTIIKGLRTSHAASLHPEMFDSEEIKVFTELLGITFGQTVDFPYNSLAARIVEFATQVEDILEQENVQRALAEALEIKLEKTPLRDYVEACVETLKNDELALRALRQLAEEYTITYNDLISKLKEKFGVEYSKDQIIKSLRKAYDLRLLDKFDDTRVSVSNRYRKHLLDVIGT
jgi:hypothetical protein